MVGAKSLLVCRFDFVDELLQRVGIPVDLGKVGWVAEGDVFKTVDFAKLPEDRAFITANAFDGEGFAKVDLLGDLLDHVVEQFGLRKRVLGIHG